MFSPHLSGPQSCHNLCNMGWCEGLYYRHHFIVTLFLVYKCWKSIANEHQLLCMKTVLCVYCADGQPSPLLFPFLSLVSLRGGPPHVCGCPSPCIPALSIHTHPPHIAYIHTTHISHTPTNHQTSFGHCGSKVGDTKRGKSVVPGMCNVF